MGDCAFFNFRIDLASSFPKEVYACVFVKKSLQQYLYSSHMGRSVAKSPFVFCVFAAYFYIAGERFYCVQSPLGRPVVPDVYMYIFEEEARFVFTSMESPIESPCVFLSSGSRATPLSIPCFGDLL